MKQICRNSAYSKRKEQITGLQREPQKIMNWWKLTRSIGIQKLVRRCKNDNSRFHFGRFFTDRTIVVKPLNSNLSDAKKK